MKKLILTLLLCFSIALVFSADLKLPDEVIVGTVNLPADSIIIHKDLSSLQSLQKLDALLYNPYLESETKDYDQKSIQKEAYLSLFLGNHWNTDFKLNYKNLKNQYLNLNNEVHYLKLAPNFSYNNLKLNWFSPNLSYLKMKPEISIDHLLFNSQYQKSNSSFIGFSSPININEYVKFIDNFELKTNFIKSKQLFLKAPTTNNDISMTELDLIMNFKMLIPYQPESHELSLSILKGHFAYEHHINSNKYIPWFDQSAIVLTYSRNILPSISFSKSFKPDDNILLRWSNEPFISYENSYSAYLKNFSASISSPAYQVQAPLNMKLAMNYFTILPIYASYQLAWYKNQEIYDYSANFDYYLTHQENTLINKFYLNTVYNYKEIALDYSFEYLKSSPDRNHLDQIPFLSHFTNSLGIASTYQNIANRTEIMTLMNRKDALNNKLKDVILINSKFEYPWKYKLNFFLKLDNLLNAHYHRFTLTPKEGIQFQLGADYFF